MDSGLAVALLPITAREVTENGGSGAAAGAGPVLEFIASDETLDRYREIIVASGWRLEAYRRNPVFQNAHQYGDIIFTLGRALLTEVREGRLFQRIEFATDVNPLAKVAHGLYQGGFLSAVSVGFIPLRWEDGDAKAGFARKYLEQELLEVSAVAIPANRNALRLGLRAGAIEQADLLDLADVLAEVIGPGPRAPQITSPGGQVSLSSGSQPGAPSADTHGLGGRSGGPQWLQLARELAAVLRRA